MAAAYLRVTCVLGVLAAVACGHAQPNRSSAAPASPASGEVSVPEPEAAAVEDESSTPAPDKAEAQRHVDPDGLVIEEIKLGSGKAAQAGDRVVVHYDGTLADGTLFDSSRKRGEPLEIQLGHGMLIEGFERGVKGMRPGGVRRVIIPPDLGYGTRGTTGIPPSSVLVFEIELIAIR